MILATAGASHNITLGIRTCTFVWKCMEIRVLLGLSANKEARCISGSNCEGGHVQMGLITSNPWLVLSSFIHCGIEWCIGQLQSALAF